MKKFFLDLGRFLRVIDDQSICLSVTNVAVFVVLIKVALNPSPSIVDMGTLLTVLSLYYGNKHLKKNKQEVTDKNKVVLEEMQAKIQAISDKASGLALHIGMRNPTIK